MGKVCPLFNRPSAAPEEVSGELRPKPKGGGRTWEHRSPCSSTRPRGREDLCRCRREDRLIEGDNQPRLAAAIAEGWKDIDTQIFEGSDIDFEKAEFAENLHRGELTKLQRDQQLARYIRLCEQEQEVILRHDDAKIGRGRPVGGVRAAARELNLPEATGRRAVATETITAPAAVAITELVVGGCRAGAPARRAPAAVRRAPDTAREYGTAEEISAN